MNVVARGLTDVEPDCFTDDEGDGFRFEFARSRPVVSTVKQLVRVLMDENDKFFSRRETLEYLDTTAGGCPQGTAQVISGFDRDAAFEDRRA